MTNQAAQTMPAVEAAVNAGLASYHGVKTFSSEVRLRSALEATARAMLATAPAASGVDTSTNEAWAARAQEKIAAMEAATGGEDDMCPNCVTPWKCNGPHESTGGASVSERARELLAQQYMGSKFAHLNAIGLCIRDGSIADDTAISFALRALEQALTQQRGECEDARKFRRLAQLLDGFDFRLGRNALMPPATYLDSVEITCEFQPGIGQSVIDAIVDVLTTEKRND